MINWTMVFESVQVPARPPGIWTLAVEFVQGPALVRIDATGAWTYSTGKSCGPDGDLNALLSPGARLVSGAPVGALVAKVGGSTASPDDGTLHTIGSRGYIQIGESAGGPLYLTINDDLPGFADNAGALAASIAIQQQSPVRAKEMPLTSVKESTTT